jgi:hypothetical protein
MLLLPLPLVLHSATITEPLLLGSLSAESYDAWGGCYLSYNAGEMIQPETWKTIGEYSGKAWSAIGPLVGVLIGAWLGRIWDSKKWQRENSKEECRELVKAITHAAAMHMNVGSGVSYSQADGAYVDSIKSFKDRIFIANEIRRKHILESWTTAVSDFRAHKINDDEFSAKIDKVIEGIVALVIVGD